MLRVREEGTGGRGGAEKEEKEAVVTQEEEGERGEEVVLVQYQSDIVVEACISGMVGLASSSALVCRTTGLLRPRSCSCDGEAAASASGRGLVGQTSSSEGQWHHLHFKRRGERRRNVVQFRVRAKASLQSPSPPSSSTSTKAHSKLIPDLSDRLTLDNIRTALIRQEDTIIFSLIERSQFKRNTEIYEAGAVSVPCFDSKTGEMKSLLEFTLREIEQLHGKLRRYTSPDERAFFDDKLPPLLLKPMDFPSVLMPWITTINMNHVVYKEYIAQIVPAVTQEGTDNNFGSTVIADVTCLQALSKRTHMGMFVAEAKFRSNRELYTRLIRENDREAIMESLTDASVEERVAKRVRNKAATYGQNVNDVLPDLQRMNEMMKESQDDFKVAPESVADLYVNWLMPLTKRVQVEYFMQRLDLDDDDICTTP